MAKSVEEAVPSVRARWHDCGLQIDVVGDADIRHIRDEARTDLPHDFEVFLRLLGVPSNEDSEGFRFWRPTEMIRADVLFSGRRQAYVADAPSLIFADYMQESWWYGIWLSGERRGQVSLLLPEPQAPIGTFGAFLQTYIADGDALYPDESWRS